MAMRIPEPMDLDQVQIFDVDKPLAAEASRVDMATSPRSDIAVFVVAPKGGDEHIDHYPQSDQILFVLRGEGSVETAAGPQALTSEKGLLIPAGSDCKVTNTGAVDLVLLSLRNEAPAGQQAGYVPNSPSGVLVRIPEEAILGKGVGHNVFVYALDRRTIAISPIMTEEWNKGSLLRMNCNYTRADGYIVADLPERMTHWYGLDRLGEGDYVLVPNQERTMVRVDLTPLIEREGSGAA